jgi:hypothetical protein
MVPRFAIGFVLVFALSVASLASSATATVSATATLTGSGTSYRLTVRNTGDEPILCFGLLLDGVQPTSASGPAGVLTRVGTFQGRGLVHMQGNAATPAVPAGGTANVDFTTNVAVPQNAGGEIRYSSTCQPGSDQIGRATGPTAPPSPPPPPKPKPPKCQCKDLQIVDGKYRKPGRADLAADFEWRLTCNPRAGRGGCEGKIEVVPPRRDFEIDVTLPPKGERTCKGGCRKVTEGPAFVRMQFGPGPRYAGQTFRIKLKLFCKRGARYVAVGAQTASISFTDRDSTGLIRFDPVQSDLNANGIPDGDEKK